jgi:hypothetical protein
LLNKQPLTIEADGQAKRVDPELTRMKALLIFTVLVWFVWFAAESVASHVDLWKLNARRDLIPLKTRIELTPGHKTIELFQVHYDEPHYVGLEFDDKVLADSVYNNMWQNPSNHFMALHWMLLENRNELVHYSTNRPNGSYGKAFAFGRFNAIEGKKYELDLVIDSLPSFSTKDSSYLEIGVDHAVVSVGNEFGYGLIESVANFLRKPALWIAVFLSPLSMFSLGRRYANRNKQKNHPQ